MSEARRQPDGDQPGRPDAYFSLGFENYVAGRHAADCGYVQVAAHLFHHAVELILKSELLTPAYEKATACLDRERNGIEASLDPEVVRHDPDRVRVPHDLTNACLAPYIKSAEELEDQFRHSLPRLWREFKKAKPRLETFDPFIARLHQWEDIRYPTFHGGQANAIAYSPRGPRASIRGHGPVNRYNLNLDEVDELVAALMVAVRFNPALIPMHAGRSPKGPGLDAYVRNNRHALWTPASDDPRS